METRSGKAGNFVGRQVGQEWEIRGPKGRVGGLLPADVFAREGIAMLEAFAAGRKYEPTAVTAAPAAVQQKSNAIVNALETGRDHCYSVSSHVRGLARAEFEEGASYQQAVQSQQAEQWPGFERELFARLHGGADPIGESPDADAWLRALHEQVDQTPEWSELQAHCKGDPWAAGIGAEAITRALGSALGDILGKAPQKDAERVREEAEALALIGLPSEPLTEQAIEIEEHGAVTALRIAGKDVDVRQAVAIAADQALHEVQELQGAMTALGASNGPGVASRVKAPRDEIRKLLQKNPTVRRIAQIAGRLKIRARQAQRSKVNYVPEQIVDVTLGAEISRLLPSETMLLADGETELLLLKKLLERQALEYRLEGREALERGPVILCVDGSNSMEGARHEWAMGLALSILEVCAQQRRPFALIHFDTQVQKEWIVKKPAALGLTDLVEAVTFFSNGGTAFSPPLQRALTLIERDRGNGDFGKADVVLLTDGQGAWDPNTMANLKRLGTSVYGVAIEENFNPGQIEQLAGVAYLKDLSLQSEAEIGVVFGGI